MILYLWDSINNYPYLKDQLKYFDKVYSFDPYDCKKNKVINHLPLFYCEVFKKSYKRDLKKTYKISSIFTAHPNRIHRFQLFENDISDLDLNSYFYPYINFLQYLYYLFTDRRIKIKHLFSLKFKKLSRESYIKILHSSEVIFDVPHEGQSGLTMRIFEALGSNCKIITTNNNIINYDFYNKNNILVLNENTDIDELIDFLNKTYVDIDSKIYYSYSISQWVNKILRLK